MNGSLSLRTYGERITNFKYSVKPAFPEQRMGGAGSDNTSVTIPQVGENDASVSYDKIERNQQEPAKRADAVREFKAQQDD